MEYVIPIKNWYDAKTTSRSNLSMVRYVFNELDKEHKKKLKISYFGKFCEIGEIKLSEKLMHNLLLRRKTYQRSHAESISEELWFGFGENMLLQEYFDGAEFVVPNK